MNDPADQRDHPEANETEDQHGSEPSTGLNPEATSPAVSTASVTPKPPGVRLKLLAVAPAQ